MLLGKYVFTDLRGKPLDVKTDWICRECFNKVWAGSMKSRGYACKTNQLSEVETKDGRCEGCGRE